jgi:glutamate synthase (NADPH/NADH) small chain
MADPRGFITTPRQTPARRPVDVRIQDWQEVYTEFSRADLERQAGRCMDCGIPFCHNGCPLGNLIPEWNDLVWASDWRAAAERLHATNNFPEFTGRLCPAPCETACVLGINADPVAIKQVEVEIIDRAWAEGWVPPQRPSAAAAAAGRRAAVIGSGPAGLAAAQQLTRAGHAVTVYERADRPGGLLRYGIPEFKLEKRHLDRRLVQMLAEGTSFRCGVNVGVDVTADQLRADYDAVVLAGGATVARGLPVPGAELDGIHQAMDYLPLSNRAVAEGRAADGGTEVREPAISARGRRGRLPGHRAAAASGVRGPAGNPAPAAAAPARDPALAHLPDDLPGVQRARGRRRSGLRRLHPGVPRRRGRPGASAQAGGGGVVGPGLYSGAKHRTGAAV